MMEVKVWDRAQRGWLQGRGVRVCMWEPKMGFGGFGGETEGW